ncbi:MAG: hypothetical protein JW894_11595 [Bacteroidales bacterium]|nr:hypothetical protein [Bacteroidales bacterium]
MELADNFMEAKYSLKSSMQMLMEIIASEVIEELEENWGSAQKHMEEFTKNINEFKNTSEDESWGDKYSFKKSEIVDFGESLGQRFNSEFEPGLKKVYNMKKVLLTNSRSVNAETADLKNIKSSLHDMDEELDNAGSDIISELKTWN